MPTDNKGYFVPAELESELSKLRGAIRDLKMEESHRYKTLTIKKKGQGCYAIHRDGSPNRSRWGDLHQVMWDIRGYNDTGVLSEGVRTW